MNFKAINAALILLAMMCNCAFAAAQTSRTQPVEQTPATVAAVVVQLEDEINDYTRDDLIRRFREAREKGAKAIILEINSYGGSALAGLETSRFIKQQKDIQVMAFVKEKAISAGAMIAVACDGIWMAPHSFIGDSGVIAMSSQGVQELGPLERAKAESPVVEDFRDSAARNGYNSLLLESMVVMGREVYYLEDKDGKRQFADGEHYQELVKEGWKPVLKDRNPLDSKDSLLTLNAITAREVGLARDIVNSTDEVAAKMGWTVIARLDRTAGDRIVALLSGGMVRGLLITILMVSIYLAVQTPGMGLPEGAVAVCLCVLLGVPLMTGYAQWWEVLLVMLGLVLLAVEIFVIPGFGLIGVTGITMVLLGLIMTFVPAEPPGMPGVLPGFEGSWVALRQGFTVVMLSLLSASAISFALARYLPRMPLFNKLVLTRTVGGGHGDGESATEDPRAVAAIAWVQLGAGGLTLTDLRPGGTVQFYDAALQGPRNVDVICDSGFIPAGSKVVVHEVLGSTLVVRKAV